MKPMNNICVAKIFITALLALVVTPASLAQAVYGGDGGNQFSPLT